MAKKKSTKKPKKRSSSTVDQVGYEPGGGSAKRKLYGGYGSLPNGANGGGKKKK
jgi:hypothetical protein